MNLLFYSQGNYQIKSSTEAKNTEEIIKKSKVKGECREVVQEEN